MSLFLAAALGRTGLWVVRKVKFLRSTFLQPGNGPGVFGKEGTLRSLVWCRESSSLCWGELSSGQLETFSSSSRLFS